jgi:hypothetical protein
MTPILKTVLQGETHMIHAAVVAALVSMSLGISADAMAKSRGSSHASSHSSSGSHPNHADEAHAGEGGGGGVSSAVSSAAPARSDNNGSGNAATAPATAAAEDDQDPSQRRIREARAAARAKSDAEDLAARRGKAPPAGRTGGHRRSRGAEAARDRDRIKNKELAALERQRAQAAWEARCQIKPVMTDEEINTCREVWSKPPR